MHLIWKILIGILFLAILYIIGCILYAKVTYYDPPLVVNITENPDAKPISQRSFRAMIWNIGYCGLGAKSDFFYDGGKMVRPNKEDLDTYFAGMMSFLKNDSSDFVMLQEVDSQSRRSYGIDQVSFIEAQAREKQPYSHFAVNYRVNYIPQPWLEPMGGVTSGLLSLAKYEPYKVERHQLPGAFGFPKQLFFLRRCLLIQYYKIDNGKSLVLINIHNSAYDDDGKLKAAEMDYLKKILSAEELKGNYILCGGDWNQCPPDFAYNKLAAGKQGDYSQSNVDSAFLLSGHWVYDSQVPSNRKNDKAYDRHHTFVTVIDFFWHSDNILIDQCKGISQNFQHSDHQPVSLQFTLKNE